MDLSSPRTAAFFFFSFSFSVREGEEMARRVFRQAGDYT